MTLECTVEDCPNCVNPVRMCQYHRSLCKCTEDEDHPDCPIHSERYESYQWTEIKEEVN